jgi:hypothetical protein
MALNRRMSLWALVAGQLASLLLLAICVWWVYRELTLIIGGSKITASISWGDDINGALRNRLAVFGLAVLLLHALLGFLGFLLARLFRAAFPSLQAEQLPSLTILCVVVLFGLALAANAAWYPASRFAAEDSWLLGTWAGLSPLAIMAACFACLLAAVLGLAMRRARWSPRAGLQATIALVVVASAGLAAALSGARPIPTGDDTRPHIVILGIDSLRDDLAEASQGQSLTPRIDAFLDESTRFSDATSPLARTYPAWVSILTGRHPASTNARFNLMPRELVHEGTTLADALGAAGYRSVYATDEVRFANFDRTYGFDELITPPIGASDFVVPTVGDMPLVNVVSNTRFGAWLFPNIHGNRAAAALYQPRNFVERLDRELDISGPSFLAIHLTLAHWPYNWAGRPRPSNPQEYRPAYRLALQQVDRQFEEVLGLLERKGVLEKAIVVVLSDHGEALGYPSDSIVRKTGTSMEIWDSLWGHGTSVLSPHQYGVVFAMRAFGSARLPGEPAIHDWPVSLEDLRPTLEELATGRPPRDVDGVSLVPFLAKRAPLAALDARVRFTETCFNTPKLMEGKITESGLVSEAGVYYELVPATGWVQLRPDRLPEIMAKKQRAALSRNALLARIPSWTDDSVTYLFADRRAPVPRRLEGPPDASVDPEAARLWQALQERFPGELEDPRKLP